MKIEDIIKTKAEMPLHRKTIINLLYTENWLNEKINTVLKPHELSIQQFNVLRILKGQEGKPANLSTIQDRMVSKMSNTTRLVDKLIKKSYVKRVTCPDNRRKVEITITSQGLTFLDKVSTEVEQFEKLTVSPLTSQEQEQLNELLNKFRNQ